MTVKMTFKKNGRTWNEMFSCSLDAEKRQRAFDEFDAPHGIELVAVVWECKR